MKTPRRYIRAFRRRCARVFDPTTKQFNATLGRAYYQQQLSCEIPNLWLLLERFLGKRQTGWFVEVGAFDGRTGSNTWGPASRGWTGLLVDPIEEHARQCVRNHQRHPNVKTIRTAIGAPGVESVQFEMANTLTTGNQILAEEYRQTDWASVNMTGHVVEVECVTLDELLTGEGVPHNFDLLSVDVEGFEGQVFAGFDLPGWRPKMMIVELVDTHPDLRSTAQVDAKLSKMIVESGYHVVFKDAINTVFVHEATWEASF